MKGPVQKRMPPLNWLRSFEAAARNLSFTTAAAELFITQSAVSQQVRLLEGFLGQALFLRGQRGLRLTESGRNYLPFVRNAFHVLEEGTQSFLGFGDQEYLHIKANNAFCTFWLMPHLGEFLAANPGLRVHVTTALTDMDYEGSLASVEIRYGRGEWYGDEARLLKPVMLRPVCAPEVAARIEGGADLAQESILHLVGLGDGWDYWAEAAGRTDLKGLNGHFFSTFVLAYEMAKQGEGIALGHDILVAEHLKRGDLVYPIDLPVRGRDNYYLIVTGREHANPAVTLFSDWIMNRLPPV
ncbi:MAG: LysR family transcriptional regulator [Pseudomonadota bacterium]